MAAALWMLAAMLILGVIDNFIVVVAEVISVWQMYFIRLCIALPVIYLAARLLRQRFLPVNWGPVLLRSFLFASAMLFYFASLAFLPIAQSLAGLFTSPIIVVTITALFLREKIGAYRIGAVIAGFVGTLIVLQVSPGNFSPLVIVPVIGGVLYALNAVITRRMCGGESTCTLLAGTMGMQGILGILGLGAIALFGIEEVSGPLAFVTRGWGWPMEGVSLLLVGHVLGSIVGVFALTRAYQLGEASHVAVFEYSIMVFGPAFAFVWFGQSLSAVQMAGVGLIIAAGAVIALRSGRG
jgi:drug/metabolite transporter (DMT)-like permease